MRENEHGALVQRLIGPRGYGIFMISHGLFALLVATVHHVLSMRQLRAHDPALPRSLAAPLGALISVLGLLALLAVLFRQ